MSTDHPDGAPTVPADLLGDVQRLFFSGEHYGPYQRVGDHVEVLMPGTLYRFPVMDESESQFALHVYRGLESTGGFLWEREVRALLRISTLEHPALPAIADGGYDEDANLAFVVTSSTAYDLGHPEGFPALRARPTDTMRQFTLLCDGLCLLHGQGIMHRNLTPRAIQVHVEGDEDDEFRFSLRLARFEMSALVSNLLRRISLGEELLDGELKRIWEAHARRDRVYFAPERLGYLTPDGSGQRMDTDRSDVYSLGVLAWELFVGEFPPELLARTDAVLQGDLEWAEEIRQHMLGEMTRRRTPRHLRDLIEGMLVREQRARLQSGEVVRLLTESYSAFTADAGDTSSTKGYLLAFQPKETRFTVPAWGWIDHDPATPEGREEMIRFLQDDELRDAELLYHEQGADIPAVSGEKVDAKRAARHVLVGKRGVWFCKRLEIRRFGRVVETCDDCLVIRFVAQRSKAAEIAGVEYRKRVPKIEVVPADNEELVAERRKGRPDWGPLMETVEGTVSKPAWRQNWERAIDWLMEFQEIQLRAREYPFVVIHDGSPHPTIRHLGHDRDRDIRRADNFRSKLGSDSGMFKKFGWESAGRSDEGPSATRFRQTFGDFFDDIASEGTWFEFCEDRDGGPDWRSVVGTAKLVKTRDDDHITVDSKSGPMPSKGWLRPKGDEGMVRQLDRQVRARDELLANAALLRQLDNPTSIRGLRHRWDQAGGGLSNEGGAVDCIKDMLSAQAFYALHGPPGTGKTTITAKAIEAFLRAEPYARILVSAQSNYALDNIARKVQQQVGDAGLEVLAIRVGSVAGEDKIDPQLQSLTVDNQAVAKVNAIQQHCAARLERGGDSDEIRAILGEWRAAAAASHVEICERLRNGANLVYCTCNTATEPQCRAPGQFGIYDWVIVEEAAKAWPTELALPLVRGTRWTLIGDHKQLGAFQTETVERFLEACENSTDRELKAHGRRRLDYAKVFRFFENLFDSLPHDASPAPADGQPAAAAVASADKHGKRRPLGELRHQYRMRAPIAGVVSHAFYDRPLTSSASAQIDSGVVRPHALAKEALVWMDTEGLEPDDDDRNPMRNTLEADLVGRLLHELRLRPTEDNQLEACVGQKLANRQYSLDELLRLQRQHTQVRDELLAVLSPYAQQVNETLPSKAQSKAWLRCLHTVDAFQGREANLVVVSLVRDQLLGNSPLKNLGFLTRPERVNVLLSRAKRLLVIVGRFQHFLKSDVPFWKAVCEQVADRGKVIPAAEILGDGAQSDG